MLVEGACRELGVRALHLEVERQKVPAQTLYRRRASRITSDLTAIPWATSLLLLAHGPPTAPG